MKKFAGAATVFCLVVTVIVALHKTTLNKTSQGCIQLVDFYGLDDNTVDVLFVGSSHVYYSFNTCRLYGQHGLASYLLASPGQPVWMSYYFLEEALKTQSPQLVVFDVCTLYRKESDIGAASWPSLISMKPSLTKWKAVCAVNEEGSELDAVGAFLSFPYYHTRYSQLTRQDYDNTQRVRYNGYKPDFRVISKEELAKWGYIRHEKISQAKAITPRAEAYLRKLIELCRQKGIPLLMVNAPHANLTDEKKMAYNYVGGIAAEYGVPFLDGNYHLEEMQMDFAKDLLEASHLNYYGSIKYTDFVADYIGRHYKLPDRRGDRRYQNWETVSRKFQHMVLYGRHLEKIDVLADYSRLLPELEGCVAVVFNGQDGRAAVLEDGAAVFQTQAGEEYFRHFDLGSSDLVLSSRHGEHQVLLDKKSYLAAKTGVNILVYDKVAKRVIDGAGFDQNGDRM